MLAAAPTLGSVARVVDVGIIRGAVETCVRNRRYLGWISKFLPNPVVLHNVYSSKRYSSVWIHTQADPSNCVAVQEQFHIVPTYID
jgi:hypothetical protein